ncbi:Gp37-like protein [Corynebacterium neomassiliense]|uniref:Gp37-like protein n=1 Tax=Corynebacterium neomassiliense TaxID=2079482 RepID=UPI001032336C|nr:hypothetical protein [Corynebacterium neomassiliense]
MVDQLEATNPLDLMVWDNDHARRLPLRGYMSVELNQSADFTTGTGKLTVPSSHPLAKRIMQSSSDVVPVSATNGSGWWWTGKIDAYEASGRPGREIIEAELTDWKTLLNIPAWPSTRTALEMQTKRDYQIGPLHTVATHYISENLARVGTPAYVMLPEGVDTSPLVDVTARMTMLPELLNDLIVKHDWVLDVDMWWPGKPFPEGKMAPLTGGSKLERFAALSTARADAVLRPGTGRIFEPTVPGIVVSVHPVRERPHVRFSINGRDVQQFKLTGRTPGPRTAIVGGKSDDWVNELIGLAIDSAAQAIIQALGELAGPLGSMVIGSVAGTIESNMTDTLIAYQQRTDVEQKAALGPFGPTESFTSSSAGAYTFDTSELAERQLMEDEGGQGIEITIADGVSKVLGDDVHDPSGKWKHGWRVGDRTTFEEHLSGTVVSDIITGVTVRDSVGEHMRITPQIGKTRVRENAFTRMVGILSKLTHITTDMGLQG